MHKRIKSWKHEIHGKIFSKDGSNSLVGLVWLPFTNYTLKTKVDNYIIHERVQSEDPDTKGWKTKHERNKALEDTPKHARTKDYGWKYEMVRESGA